VTSAVVEIYFDCNQKINFWILSMLFVVSEDLSFFLAQIRRCEFFFAAHVFFSVGLGVHLLKFPACSVSCIGATM
jgi:hypothetical protein